MRVAFRVDASSRIGLGHLHRCMALAHSLREFGSRIVFVARASDFDTRGEVLRRGFEAATLHASAVLGVVPMREGEPQHAGWAGVQWQQDASETASVLADWKPDWVVVDHYSFDARWHRHVIEALGSRVAVIDDLADRDLCASLLIDHNLSKDHQRKYAGRIEAGIRILGGPRFALVGPRYATMRRARALGNGALDRDLHGWRGPARLQPIGLEGLSRACRVQGSDHGRDHSRQSESDPFGVGDLKRFVDRDPYGPP